MKKTFWLVLLFFLFMLYTFLQDNYLSQKSERHVPNTPITKPTQIFVRKTETEALFVPYWTVENEAIRSDGFDRLIYFGIAVDENGIVTNEEGYKRIDAFLRDAKKDVPKELVIRMIHAENNFSILANKKAQGKIAADLVSLLKTHKFSGIVLDLEIASLPFASVVGQVDEYVTLLEKKTKENNATFSMMLFGDTFYRFRPYDVAFLSAHADEIFVMAYDFHKANGDPGPNFPLSGQETYAYDFQTMTTDFLNIVPLSKLTIVFGLFGYDWKVDKNQKSTGQATSRSFVAMHQLFEETCNFINCLVTHDSKQSSETKVLYTDTNGENHVVWFENLESVAKKKSFLTKKGIKSTALWAYSYF